MFWTIVGALLFVSVGLPIVLSILWFVLSFAYVICEDIYDLVSEKAKQEKLDNAAFFGIMVAVFMLTLFVYLIGGG